MYNYICKKCGKEFTGYKKDRAYCSRECYETVLKDQLSERKKDLKDKRFGRLVAIESKNVNGRYSWLCKCDCGNTVWVSTPHLLNGHTKSCGCLNREILSKNNSKIFSKYRESNYVDGTSLSKINSKLNKNNSSGVRGVYYDSSSKMWVAKLTFQRKTYKKYFKSKKEAIAYRKLLEEDRFKPVLDKYSNKPQN